MQVNVEEEEEEEDDEDEKEEGREEKVECPICGEVTSDQLHYGGLACPSCKAFFRRTVAIHRAPRRPCRGEGKCPLRNKRRNNCPDCRFRRCLESGLRPELVKSGQSESRRLISPKPKVEEPVAEKELDIWESVMACHRLVLSQTAGISLMVVPTRVTVALAARIREEEDREGVVQEVLQVARIEHAFLTAKECIGFFNESLSREKMEVARQQGAYPALVFTAVQEFFVQLVVIFLKSCQHFQALTWPCQARLLRKNIAEISLILTTMCFHREQQVFR